MSAGREAQVNAIAGKGFLSFAETYQWVLVGLAAMLVLFLVWLHYTDWRKEQKFRRYTGKKPGQAPVDARGKKLLVFRWGARIEEGWRAVAHALRLAAERRHARERLFERPHRKLPEKRVKR